MKKMKVVLINYLSTCFSWLTSSLYNSTVHTHSRKMNVWNFIKHGESGPEIFIEQIKE